MIKIERLGVRTLEPNHLCKYKTTGASASYDFKTIINGRMMIWWFRVRGRLYTVNRYCHDEHPVNKNSSS